MKLDSITKGRNNNLDIIRFIAALMVIFSHAFPISLGMEVYDPLARITNDQISFGSLAVSVFFVYGGFLICKSMHRLQGGKAFFKARILRIFPPLIFVVLISVFVIGPVFTDISLGEYFTSGNTYKYLLNCILVLQHNLPGVFEQNIYKSVVNGPLWTMPVEFMCYIMCFILYKLNLLEKKTAKYTTLLFVVGCSGIGSLSLRIQILKSMIRPVGLFFVGMLYYVYREKIVITKKWTIFCLIGIIISLYCGMFPFTIFLFLPYVLFYLGYGTSLKIKDFARKGEISYGIYLSAWPIQQIICSKFSGQMNPWINFLITLPLAIIMGVVINKCVEEPVLKLKGK